MKQLSFALWIVVAVAAAGLAWIGVSRHNSRLRFERAAQSTRDRDYRTPDDGTDTTVRITQFYARSGEITDGDSNVVCYGVRNAAAVRIDPPVESLSPARSRCFSVEPHQDTTYQLVAEAADGVRATESFVVRVKPAPPAIVMMAASSKQVRRGDAVTVCYKTEHARAVRLDPIGWSLVPVVKNCTRFYPKLTGTYTLIAAGDAGLTDRKAFSVEVR